MGLVIFFIMIVAAFNIVGTLTMVVTDKTREIGILQAMGLTGRSIGRIFLPQGALIGVVGTSPGSRSGSLHRVHRGPVRLIRLDPAVYFIDHLPVTCSCSTCWWCRRELPARRGRHLLSRRAARRGSRRSRRSGTNERRARGRGSARSTTVATASRSRCSRASTSASPGARSSRSSARAGRQEHAAASAGALDRPTAGAGIAGRARRTTR